MFPKKQMKVQKQLMSYSDKEGRRPNNQSAGYEASVVRVVNFNQPPLDIFIPIFNATKHIRVMRMSYVNVPLLA